jgi:hypothetical protein
VKSMLDIFLREAMSSKNMTLQVLHSSLCILKTGKVEGKVKSETFLSWTHNCSERTSASPCFPPLCVLAERPSRKSQNQDGLSSFNICL